MLMTPAMRSALWCAAALVAAVSQISQAGTYTQYVDTTIGTGGVGYGIGSLNPGAQVPFGAMRLGPDTSVGPIWLSFNHFGGYYYNDTDIRAFSHTHLVGAGVADWGNLGVMAVRNQSTSISNNYGYLSQFSHATEVAVPGYYSVYLDTPQARAEMTVSGTLSGMHRYTFENADSSDAYLLFDMCHTVHAGDCASAFMSVSASDNVTVITGGVLNSGSLTGRGPQGGVWVYFFAMVNSSLSFQMWENKQFLAPGTAFANTTSGSLGLFVGISNADSAAATVAAEVRVGMSFLSVDNAKENLLTQQQDLSFDAVRQNADSTWDAILSRVVATGPAYGDGMVKLYSSLYRTLLAPTNYLEVSNEYMGMDDKIHTWDHTSGGYLSDMSIWDIHRTEAPWLGLVAPDVARDIARSLLLMYEQGGHLPKWPIANVYSGCMTGQHEVVILSDYIAKGIAGFNQTLAFQAALAAVSSQDSGSGFDQFGFVPSNRSDTAASDTLDYAFDDWAVAQIARSQGDNATFDMLMARSRNYRNIWSDSQMFFCPKTEEGAMQCPSVPAEPYFLGSGYVEGDAWQYQWFVPGDIEGLVSLFPSPDTYVGRLNEFFAKSESWFFGNFLPNPYYWAGNEPDIFAPWQFPFAGLQYVNYTQYWTRYELQTAYTLEASGLPGNDDFGTMSAWSMWAFLGLYPIAGSDRYVLGSPAFSQITVQLPATAWEATSSARTAAAPLLTMMSHNNSASAVYVSRATINGVPLSTPFVTHSQLLNNGQGGVLEFWMSDTPSTWGQ